MYELLNRVNANDLSALLFMLALALVMGTVMLTALVTKQVRRYHETNLATTVILEMLDRGMTADEIKGVLQAAGMEHRDDRISLLRRKG